MTTRMIPALCCSVLAFAAGCAGTVQERVPEPRRAALPAGRAVPDPEAVDEAVVDEAVAAEAVAAEAVAAEGVEAVDDVVETTDPYEDADTVAAVTRRLCFLAHPGVQAQAAAFDGGIGVAIQSGKGVGAGALRDNAQILASSLTGYAPRAVAATAGDAAERLPVAGSEDANEGPKDDATDGDGAIGDRIGDLTDAAVDAAVDAATAGAIDEAPASEAIAVSVTASDVDGGVMLLLVPDDPAMIGELMHAVQDELAVLNAGRCGL